jgi:putative transposase
MVTISQDVDGWYVCFSCVDVPVQPLPATGQETGIDLGLEAFATLSDGTRIFNPGWYRKAERALKTAQRRVSRRKKGSARRRKAVTLLARAHQKVRRQRQDFHHKTALQLVRKNDTIYHEELQTANMLKNHHLAKSIQDAGWSAFLRILAYKAACAGRRVEAVNPTFTSQRCSGCGILVAKGLSVRWHSCPDCGTSLHRDHNAAKNRERLGQSRRGAVVQATAENREPPAVMWGVSNHMALGSKAPVYPASGATPEERHGRWRANRMMRSHAGTWRFHFSIAFVELSKEAISNIRIDKSRRQSMEEQKKSGFATVDEYIASFPDATQLKLRELRATIKTAAPEAEEKMSYQMPTVYLKGNLVYYAAWKKHIGFYAIPSANEAFKDELAAYTVSKGAVQFPLDQPLPVDLITRMVRFRVEENLARTKARQADE